MRVVPSFFSNSQQEWPYFQKSQNFPYKQSFLSQKLEISNMAARGCVTAPKFFFCLMITCVAQREQLRANMAATYCSGHTLTFLWRGWTGEVYKPMKWGSQTYTYMHIHTHTYGIYLYIRIYPAQTQIRKGYSDDDDDDDDGWTN